MKGKPLRYGLFIASFIVVTENCWGSIKVLLIYAILWRSNLFSKFILSLSLIVFLCF